MIDRRLSGHSPEMAMDSLMTYARSYPNQFLGCCDAVILTLLWVSSSPSRKEGSPTPGGGTAVSTILRLIYISCSAVNAVHNFM